MAKTILVVEDEFLILDIVMCDLRDEGYIVYGAVNGKEATELLNKYSFDVLFTDIRLPGEKDGWEIAIEARNIFPNIQVIYATGYNPNLPRYVENSIVIPKPYSTSTLLNVINN